MDKQIIFRLSEEEKKKLVSDAHKHEMTRSDYLRFLIRSNHKEEKK